MAVHELAAYDAETGTTAVANHFVYDAYGRATSETNAAIDTLFAFTGRALDPTTGLQNNGYRWYDAEVGRWISEDPIGFDGRDTNLGRYCRNNPTNLTDPTGEIVPVVVGVVVVVYWFWPDTANAPGLNDHTIPSDPYEGMPYAAVAGAATGGAVIAWRAYVASSAAASAVTTATIQGGGAVADITVSGGWQTPQ